MFTRCIIQFATIIALTACDRQPEPAPSTVNSIGWTEVTDDVGLPAKAEPWPDGQYHIPEIMGGGVVLFDCDNDGDLDIYQVVHPKPSAWPTSEPAPNRLYQQQADGTFIDVSKQSGLDDAGYGMGSTVGDIDNDGDLDVFVTNIGENRLYRNNGDGTFTNAGFDDAGKWSSTSAFIDIDRDGHLDLFVAQYVEFDPTVTCKAPDGTRSYCNPQRFRGVTDTLYKNNGDGTFTNITESSGITGALRGLGVACVDINSDGWIDIVVANDVDRNQVWINQKDGTFKDEGMRRGVALNGAGKTEAGMGTAIGDIDHNGMLDLFMSHESGETNTLFQARAQGEFTDRSASSGLGRASLPWSGWGCAMFDYDHDGDLDLVVVNGRTAARREGDLRFDEMKDSESGRFWGRFAQPNLMFANNGAGQFSNVSDRSGSFGSHMEVSRGLAAGDIDNDGDIDLITTNIGNTIRVFRNDVPKANGNWLTVRARTAGRDAVGAIVTIDTGERKFIRVIAPAQSYQSCHDARLHFGLGSATAGKINVVWPDGQNETFTIDRVNEHYVFDQGHGRDQR